MLSCLLKQMHDPRMLTDDLRVSPDATRGTTEPHSLLLAATVSASVFHRAQISCDLM